MFSARCPFGKVSFGKMGGHVQCKFIFALLLLYTKRTKVFVHVQTVPHGRNMHATYVISTEDNFKRFNISNHRLNLK